MASDSYWYHIRCYFRARGVKLAHFLILQRNSGTLPNKKRKREFAALKDEEVAKLEEIVRDAFDVFDTTPGANLHSEADE